MQPVKWVDDWPMMGDAHNQPVRTHAAPDTGKWRPDMRLQTTDEFSEPTLGLQWAWNHNPDDARWSLTERPGYLRLKAGPAEHLTTARNTITQILQGPYMQSTARLEVAGMVDGQRAGLTLFGVGPAWIGVVREGSVTRVVFSSAGVETPGPVIEGGHINLRATVTEDQTVRFAYDLGEGLTPFGPSTPLSKFSWWKGSRPGLFTYVKAAHGSAVPDNHVDIDWFRVSLEPAP